ncbi:hypothetical protein DPMN_180378 [Dreissena polymorpha]|uniref:Uncharacterized protein n=1 Tax=Dreissena polymorpha TaxID=45954 RepID=A0A9D4EI06_DREPO|nr:hypothetical protein DPMN_180378 [Dreissena polymorpha]
MKLSLLIFFIGLLVGHCMTQRETWPYLPNETYHCPACGHSVVKAEGVTGIQEIIERDHHPNYNTAENKAPLDVLCHLACASVFFPCGTIRKPNEPRRKDSCGKRYKKMSRR